MVWLSTIVSRFITTFVRSTMRRYCFHRCLSVHSWGGGGLPHFHPIILPTTGSLFFPGGTPVTGPRSLSRGYPVSSSFPGLFSRVTQSQAGGGETEKIVLFMLIFQIFLSDYFDVYAWHCHFLRFARVSDRSASLNIDISMENNPELKTNKWDLKFVCPGNRCFSL